MKKYFFTGLVILLPLALTFLIVNFIVNLITKPFLGTVSSALDHYDTLNKPFLFFSEDTALFIVSKAIILLILFLTIILVGFLAELFVVKLVRNVGDYVLHRIPLVNKVYKATQDVVNTVFVKKSKGKGNAEKTSFSAVVLVSFPHRNAYSLGLITNDSDSHLDDPDYRGSISVFVPGTPNPAMGFMLLFKKEQLIYLDMKVDEAFKFCVSCGVIAPVTLTGRKSEES